MLFSKFPKIYYNNKEILDLSIAIVIPERIKNNKDLFFWYEIPEGEKPDGVAFDFYGNSNYEFIIYLMNDMVDPHWDWPMDQNMLYDYCVKKYGTAEEPTDAELYPAGMYTVKHWVDSVGTIHESAVADDGGTIYVVVQKDQIDGSNLVFSTDGALTFTSEMPIIRSGRTYKFTYSNPDGATYTWSSGEDLRFTSDGSIEYTSGITRTGASTAGNYFTFVVPVTVPDVLYFYNGTVIYTEDSQFVAGAVSFYEYEEQKNDAKRKIKMLHPELLRNMDKEIERLF